MSQIFSLYVKSANSVNFERKIVNFKIVAIGVSLEGMANS